MMRRALEFHPSAPPRALLAVEVELRPGRGDLALRYRVTGSIDNLLFPAAAAPERQDRLWQHTCFELFVRPGAAEPYYEFNFSPSGEWAVYAFTSHRSGMSSPPFAGPEIRTHIAASGLELMTALDLQAFSPLADAATWQIGLSVILEETGGYRSFWALAHPPGEADFHHKDCFALELAAPERL